VELCPWFYLGLSLPYTTHSPQRKACNTEYVGVKFCQRRRFVREIVDAKKMRRGRRFSEWLILVTMSYQAYLIGIVHCHYFSSAIIRSLAYIRRTVACALLSSSTQSATCISTTFLRVLPSCSSPLLMRRQCVILNGGGLTPANPLPPTPQTVMNSLDNRKADLNGDVEVHI